MFNIIRDLVFGGLFLGMEAWVYWFAAGSAKGPPRYLTFGGAIMLLAGTLVLTGLAWRTLLG